MIIVDLDTKLLYEIYPVKQHGENPMTCPVCSPTRRKKHDKCFSWDADKSVGRCNHCNARFVAYKALREEPKKQYAVPEWKNKTGLTEKAVKWFEGRMISQDTLLRMRVYSDTEFMPQIGKEVDVMCFPYFVAGQLRNIKYRGPQKSFKMVKDAELVFYNIDCVTSDTKKLIICEGEIDALSFIDAGFREAVSVPNGAGSTDLTYLDNYIENLSHIETFYIAADFDDAGLKLRNELVRRLGFERCRIVTYKGRKDVNELYMSEGGNALREIIAEAKEIPVDGMISLSSRYDNICSMFMNGLPKGNGVGVAEIDSVIRWETSRLAIWTGIPSHGKSEMLDFVTTKLELLYNWRPLFFSPENFPLEYHYAKIAKKIIGAEFKQGKMSQEDFDAAYDHISANFFWVDPYSDASLEGIFKRAEYHIRRHGIKQLIIDPFNCLEHKRERSETGSEYIGRFLDELSRFAKTYDILIHLVAHPTKLERLDKSGKYPPPTLYDISGSANFYNKADYGLTVYRDFDMNISNLIVTKVKFNNLGQARSEPIELQYNYVNGRYETPKGDIYLLDNSNWLTNKPGGQFDDDDCPF